jgi:hypothetical protein
MPSTGSSPHAQNPSYKTTSPVVFCIFNRPEQTQQVFAAIREAQPSALHVVADGPRPHVANEAELCEQTRAIVEGVDWTCEVTLDFSELNLGCQERIYTGISNAFKRFEFAIILEDDCVPSLDFFKFVDQMHERYKKDESIMHISGTSFVRPLKPKISYYRSPYPLIWGWATWRRAWEPFTLDMSGWPKLKERLQNETIASPKIHQRFLKHLEKSYTGEVKTWDYPYCTHILENRGHCINPCYNLVSNIGFIEGSTHLTNALSAQANIPIDPLPESLVEPSKTEIDVHYSSTQLTNALYRPKKLQRAVHKICRSLNIPHTFSLKRP